MTDTYVINAAPMVIDLGTQDLSTVQLPRVAEAVPQHLPKFYLYTQKGPTTPQLVAGAERQNMFGIDSFNLLSAYANHATVLANEVDSVGNATMIQRVLPVDVGPNANFLMSLDVLPTTVNVFQRNSDGSFTLDVNGNRISTGSTAGFLVKWVVTSQKTVAGLQAEYGAATILPGDQVDPITLVQSQRYPIFEFQASSPGAWGNLAGIRMWAPTTANTNQMPSTMMSLVRAYPYLFNIVEAPSLNVSPSIISSVLGDQSVMTTLLPNSIDPTTDSQLYVGNVLIQSYQNITDPTYPAIFGDFSKLAIYQANINTLLAEFLVAETPFINQWSDITAVPTDLYLINIANFVSSQNVPYTAIQQVTASNSITLGQFSNIMASGGSDGTMNNAAFASLVTTEVQRYLDPTDPIQDDAVNVESIMYDSGFPLATKQAMCSFIGVRHDTFIALSTYDADQPQLDQAQEMSVAIALRTMLQMYPESTYFGTSVMRGIILGYSGTLLNSLWPKPVPLTLELANKAGSYMGASNGKWIAGRSFDGAPGSILTRIVNPTIAWLPDTVRNKAWGVGLNWVQNYDRRSVFFPAFKTVYDDDTSVLNSFFTAMAIVTINKITSAAWREFSGVDHLTPAQLASNTNDFVSAKVAGIFNNRFVIVPAAFFTDTDLARGFSWTVPVSIYANNMKTVMTTYVKAYRMNALSTTSAA